MNEREYEELKPAIRRATGVDLGSYKTPQMIRRIDGYLTRTGAQSIKEFATLILRNREQASLLKDFLTINVTEFFRDPRTWAEVENHILPDLLKGNRSLKIWSAGCSRGSEPYTLAMLLETLAPRRPHNILATDLDAGVVARARAGGPYPAVDLKNISNLRLRRWFDADADGDSYSVKNELKRRITFRQHNLLEDPFESDFDLIVCRNVVIYFSDDAKQRLYTRFANSLKPGGYFFIGGTETLLNPGPLGFQRTSTSFYRRVPAEAARRAA
jgi:chemotaxis protein methyltransferase CheR